MKSNSPDTREEKFQKFVVLSYQRAGSTFFVSTLNKMDHVVCHSELFNNGFISFKNSIFHKDLLLPIGFWDRVRGMNNQKKLFRFQQKKPLLFLDHIFSSHSCCTGFKLFPDQNKFVLNRVLNDRSIHKIILIRENLLHVYVSKQIAVKTGTWGLYESEKPKLKSVTINPVQFFTYARTIKNKFKEIEKRLKKTRQDYIKVTYEEITESFPIGTISAFLRIKEPDTVPEIKQIKQNPFSLDEMIDNFDEVRAELENSEFEKFIKNVV